MKSETISEFIGMLDTSMSEFQSLCFEYNTLVQQNKPNETILEMIRYLDEDMPVIRQGLGAAVRD